MNFERAKEFVENAIARGDSVEASIAECLDWSFCSREEAEQLRRLFSGQTVSDGPAVATQNQSEIPSAAVSNVTEPRSGGGMPESLQEPGAPMPVLQIDWGVELKLGVNVSPKFTILGLASSRQPLVYFPMETGISCDNWKSMPQLSGNAEAGWSFYQSLKLEAAGQFRMRVVVVDAEPGRSDLTYYHSDFRILVTDPKESGKRRTLEIQAEGNLASSLSNVKGFDHIILKAEKDAAVDFSGESETDKILQALANAPVEEEEDRKTLVPFARETNSVSGLPYVSEPSLSGLPSRLTLTEPSGRSFRIIGGRRLTFGRDVPEENCYNDIPLRMIPLPEDESDHAGEFAVLNRLFSREHARLELGDMGLFLSDVRQSGIQDATMLNGNPLEKNSAVLLFPVSETAANPCTVLFSKMLALRLSPHYEKFWSSGVSRPFPEELPYKLLNRLYGIDSDEGLTACSVGFEKLFQQKAYAESLKRILGKTALADSPWWNRWFASAQNVDPRHDRLEYWLVPLFVTLGRNRENAIRLKDRSWEDVHLRILYINKVLYIENLSVDVAVEYRHPELTCPLRPFRPIPLREGVQICKGQAELNFV